MIDPLKNSQVHIHLVQFRYQSWPGNQHLTYIMRQADDNANVAHDHSAILRWLLYNSTKIDNLLGNSTPERKLERGFLHSWECQSSFNITTRTAQIQIHVSAIRAKDTPDHRSQKINLSTANIFEYEIQKCHYCSIAVILSASPPLKPSFE